MVRNHLPAQHVRAWEKSAHNKASLLLSAHAQPVLVAGKSSQTLVLLALVLVFNNENVRLVLTFLQVLKRERVFVLLAKVKQVCVVAQRVISISLLKLRITTSSNARVQTYFAASQLA